MKVIILGAGIAGVTTAYFLGKAGHDVTVIDRRKHSAGECSYANGGQLSYSDGEPLASFVSLKKAIKWFGKKDAPLIFKFSKDIEMYKWLLKFIANCPQNKFEKNLIASIKLFLYSRQQIHQIVDDTKIEFDYLQKGIISVFHNQKDMEFFEGHSRLQAELGAPYQKLTPAQAVAKDPALANMESELVGAINAPIDETGNIHLFCNELAKYCQINFNAEFLYNTNIDKLQTVDDKITAIKTDKGELVADKYVIAMGSHTTKILRNINIKLPIYPLKGYSISMPIINSDKAPLSSISHKQSKYVCTRIGGILRATSTVEFAGYDDSITDYRIELLKAEIQRDFPNCADFDKIEPWACLRPMTPDGQPILGTSKYSNLYLNVGHGSRGWTQGVGASKIVVDMM